MKKIILFTTTFPWGYGETFLENEIGFLSSHFKQIIIVPLSKPSKNRLRPVPLNVFIHKSLININLENKLIVFLFGIFNFSPIKFSIKEFFTKKVYKKKKWILNWLSYTCITRAAYRSLKRNKVLEQIEEGDIVYSYWADNGGNLMPFIRKYKKNKIVVRFHRTDLYEEFRGNYLPYRLELFKSINEAVFISKHGKEYFQKKYPGLIKNLSISRLGVFDKGISPPSESKSITIVSCSNLIRVKRVHLIPLALKELHEQITWIHFGTGYLMTEINKINDTLPNNIKVSMVGQVTNSQILDFYKNNPVDLFINVSESEGLPVSIMEALSFGIPIMATDVGGVSEVVNNSNGFLLHPDSNPLAISSRIKNFIDHPNKQDLKKNARDTWSEILNAEDNYTNFCKLIDQ